MSRYLVIDKDGNGHLPVRKTDDGPRRRSHRLRNPIAGNALVIISPLRFDDEGRVLTTKAEF